MRVRAIMDGPSDTKICARTFFTLFDNLMYQVEFNYNLLRVEWKNKISYDKNNIFVFR